MRLAGKPLLAWLVERLQRTRLPIVVATSQAAEDEAVEAVARSLAVRCHRGPLEDVATRLADAAHGAKFSGFIRVSADSPLLDPALVTRARALYSEGEHDLVTNVFPRSFPKGMSVELVALDALRRIVSSSDDRDDREHVTRFGNATPARIRISTIAAPVPRPDLQLSIDTRQDFERIEACVQRLGARAIDAGWEEIADCVEARA